MGDGRYGHADLAGNVWEWTLDWYANLPGSCDNCANLSAASERVIRGGSFDIDGPAVLLNSYRKGDPPSAIFRSHGVRCARNPP
jgi:formylglycine-generating enzyme required for sulfatase activity